MVRWFINFASRLRNPKLRLIDVFRLSVLHDGLERDVTLKPKFMRYPVTLRARTSDENVFNQIILGSDYDIDLEGPVKNIIDAGANVGIASLFFANRFPDARIVALEPDQTNFDCLERACAVVKGIIPLKGALWSEMCYLRITNPDAPSYAFRVEQIDQPSENSFPGYTVDGIMKKYSMETVDILKLDIEGAEREIFSKDIDAWIQNVRVLIIELHDFILPNTAEPFFSQISKFAPYKFFPKGENLVFIRQPK